MTQVAASRESGAKETLSLRFVFTDKDAAAIIGRGGSNIKSINEATRCKLGFFGQIGGERYLVITGDVEGVSKATSMIAHTLGKHNNSYTTDLDDVRKFDRKVILLMLIPAHRCGAIIGKQGENVKDVMKKTRAGIRIFFENPQSADDRITKIEGSPEEIRQAIYMIAGMLLEFDQEGRDLDYKCPAYSGDDYSYAIPKMSTLAGVSLKISQTMQLESDIIRLIIGKGGRTINEIRQISKAHIHVEGMPNNPNQSVVTITGIPSCVALAVHLIEARVGSALSPTQRTNKTQSSASNGNAEHRQTQAANPQMALPNRARDTTSRAQKPKETKPNGQKPERPLTRHPQKAAVAAPSNS